MRVRTPLAALMLALACPAPPPAWSAPQIEVRARTAIALRPIQRTRNGITLSGSVTDRASPQPIPDVPLVINIGGALYTTLTDEDGRFEVTIPADRGVYDIRIAFTGERFLDPSEQLIESFDITNEPLELSVTANPVDDEGWEIVVRAQADGRAAEVGVVLWGGDVSALELTNLGALKTDDRGRAQRVFSRAELGGFGDKRIEARFTGDGTFDPAATATTFSIIAATKTTLRLEQADLAFEDTLRGRGVVTDPDGKPLAGQRVIMEAGNRELDETTTGEDGAFALEVEASELGEGKTAIQAVVYPRAGWLAPSRSEPVTVSIGDRKPVPLAATLAAFAATCAALLAFVVMRTKPWSRWLERFGHRAPVSASPSDEAKGRRAPGLAPARPSLVSTLRRPADFGFTGRVLDVVTRRAIASAEVRVSAGEARATTDEAGGFAIEGLPAGTFSATASAVGYMPETFNITVPHHGELRAANIDLLAVREHIFELYGELARPLLPAVDRWGVWTPRQIFEHVRTRRRAASLRALTDAVEELYFSQRTPDVDAVAIAERQIAEARSELGAV